LAVEFAGAKVTHLIFAPTARERQQYQPLTKLRSDRLEEALGQLAEYFAGARRELQLEFDLEAAGIPEASRALLLETTRIPYGETRTYQKLAAQAGVSDYRNVRSVLIANPIPILVPCHRVVPNRGGSGSYVGGAKRKSWLLRLESRTAAERASPADAALDG
jgi:methylated-DNA-[protein]-cysteine S-methyltransferase